MSAGDSLRLRDVRDTDRLTGDGSDLGSHPALRYRRMLEGLYVLVAAEYRRMGGVDRTPTSVLEVSDDGAISGIALNQAIGEGDFSPREQRLIQFFHAEIGRLIGGPLASTTGRGIEGLSPRLRQTLACLLEGDSEKQVAARLGLSTTTVHQYVTSLYRHFGVRSRPQLLAHVFKLLPAPLEHPGNGADTPPRLRLVRGVAPSRCRGTA
jgi:DNA-binding CsgD family transcriptional regulator